MTDHKKLKVATFRLEALRKNIPKEIPEERVEEYHRLVDELEAASDEDLGSFRIPMVEVKPRRVHIPIVVVGAPPQAPIYTDKKYCDLNIFSRQIEGLWSYIQHIQGSLSAQSEHPNDYWNMSDSELEQLANKYKIQEYGYNNGGMSRKAIIDQLVTRDQTLLPQTPTSSHTINVSGNMSGVIQQHSPGAQASVQFNTSEIRETVYRIKQALPELPISDAAKQELATDIQTVEPQLLSPRPKLGIVKSCLNSMRSILQEATAHTTAILLAEEILRHLDKLPH